jgi:hypothetical protein
MLAWRVLSGQSLHLWLRHSLLLWTWLVLIERLPWLWSRMFKITTANMDFRRSSTSLNYPKLSMAIWRLLKSGWRSKWPRYWDIRFKDWTRPSFNVFELRWKWVVSNLLWIIWSIQRCCSFIFYSCGDNLHHEWIWNDYNSFYSIKLPTRVNWARRWRKYYRISRLP